MRCRIGLYSDLHFAGRRVPLLSKEKKEEMMKHFFYGLLAIALIAAGALGRTVAEVLTLSQLLMAVAVVVSVVMTLLAVVAAATGVAKPPLSLHFLSSNATEEYEAAVQVAGPLWKQYCPPDMRTVLEEIERGKRKLTEAVNWWDAEHIPAGYLGG